MSPRVQTLSVSISIPKLEVQADSAQLTLEPGASMPCNLSFVPQTVGKFRCPLYFEVNGVFKISAEVVADIIPQRLEVASSAHRIVDLGAIRTGKSRKYSIELVNKALLNAEVSLEPSKELARRLGLRLHIEKGQLAAREKSTLTITYKPKVRLGPFNEAVSVLVSGAVLPLFRVKGSALGLEAKLSAETLPFGNVMLGSSTTKALQLHNLGVHSYFLMFYLMMMPNQRNSLGNAIHTAFSCTGDVGFKFSWQTEKLAPHMSLAPANGFLAPGQHVKVNVTLQPKAECADIRVDDLQCHIEGNHEPLHLAISGSASVNTQAESTLSFQCRLRESMSQTISLKNPSSQHWTLKPKIDNCVWSGKELVMVPAHETVEYTLVYKPLGKTKEEKDAGTIFFPLPDGSGILHKLQGLSTAPAPMAVLQR
jgi:hydrocephalus-inducing protein